MKIVKLIIKIIILIFTLLILCIVIGCTYFLINGEYMFINQSYMLPNTKWVSTDPDIWYQCNGHGGAGMFGELTWEGEVIKIQVGGPENVFSIEIDTNNSSQNEGLILGYVIKTSDNKIVVKISDINTDKLPGFNYKTITFIRQDDPTTATVS